MRILTKELHQQKWMVFAGCLVGLIFPAIEYWIFHEGPRRHESTSGAIAVLLGGAIFGILLALAAAYPDARKGSRDFFLARPFNCSRIFITKTLLAAVTLPMTLAVIAAPDFITSFGRTEHFALAWAIFTVTWPIALMIFSLTVFLMVLTQDQAKSLVLAAWSAVLVYLLPPFVNGFRWLSVPRHLEDAGQSVLLYLLGPPFQALIPELPRDPYGQPVVFVFEWKEMLPYLALVGAMAAMTIIFTWLAAVTVRRGWRWQPGRKTIVWAVGLASLLIFTQLVFQVGYNLRPANEVAGRPIQNPFHYNIKNALAASRPGMSGDLKVHYATSLAYGIVYSRDELMYSVVYAYERLKDSNGGKAKYIMHIILCTYRFPFTSQSNMPLDEDGPLLISAVSLFTSPKPVLQAFALGPVDGLFRDGWLYVCYQPHTQDPNNPDINKRLPLNLTAVNVSNPAAPILGPTISMPYTGRFGSRGFAVKGDYLYINAEQNLAIVSIESPGEPRLVREVPFSSLTPMSKLRQVPLGTFIYRF
ncbi:MAG TPA: hypothetical protein VLH60_01945, partial [Sedimentisphaerales bacterium]|nr:hypothetical protein [Sedimentisphaerales bacterium]